MQRKGRLHAIHIIVLTGSMLLTLMAWYISSNQIAERNEIRFERQANRLIAMLRERMSHYEEGLRAGAAAIHMLGSRPTRAEWQTFASSLHLEQRYPGVNGIGVIDFIPRSERASYEAARQSDFPGFEIYPAHDQNRLYPITLIEPVPENAAAIGLDMAHEANRLAAAERARTTGTSQITGPIQLVQASRKTPGFLFFLPYYRAIGTYSEADTEREFLGFVYAPFVVENLISGTLATSERDVLLRLSDANVVLFDELVADDSLLDPQPMFQRTEVIDFYGRNWQFDIQTGRDFRAQANSNQPAWILATGVCIELLLLYMFLTLARSNRRALTLADNMTDAYRRNNDALSRSNEDLDRFAYVASHDLKTPLRGICNLSEYIEEDLQDYLGQSDANPDVAANLQRIRERTRRLDRLISDILHYSRSSVASDQLGVVDVDRFAEDLREDHGLGPEQLAVSGQPRQLVADQTRLEQVLTNLVANAITHHDGREPLAIEIRCHADASFYDITVADNGPGIEPRFHAKIFEVFQTLATRADCKSTGIGLSIVSRTLQSVGGDITLESAPGAGAAFRFRWPRPADESHYLDDQAAA